MVTRAQAATYVVRTFNASEGLRPSSVPDAFPDDDGSIHEDSINVLPAMDAAAGSGSGFSYPSDFVTQDDLALMLDGMHRFRTGDDVATPAADASDPLRGGEEAAKSMVADRVVAVLESFTSRGYAATPPA